MLASSMSSMMHVKHVKHDTLRMYFRIYKHVLYSAEKKSSYFSSLVFLLSIKVTQALLIREIYISNHIYLLYFYTSLVLTHLLVIDNVIQESNHSYSISVLLWDMSAYSDNSCLINYIIINFRLRSSIESSL